MARVCRLVFAVTWGLGLISLVVGVGLALLPSLAPLVRGTPRGGVILAGALFLCALATREMEKLVSSAS